MDSLKLTLREHEEDAGLKAVSYDGDSVSGTKDPHYKFDMVADFAYHLSVQIEEKEKMIREVEAVIEAVEEPLHRTVLRQHYINRYTWEEVWLFLGYEPHTGYVMTLQTEAENMARIIIEQLEE